MTCNVGELNGRSGTSWELRCSGSSLCQVAPCRNRYCVGCRDDRVGHGHDRLLPGLDLVGNQYLSDEEGIRKTVSKQRSAHIEPVI